MSIICRFREMTIWGIKYDKSPVIFSISLVIYYLFLPLITDMSHIKINQTSTFSMVKFHHFHCSFQSTYTVCHWNGNGQVYILHTDGSGLLANLSAIESWKVIY